MANIGTITGRIGSGGLDSRILTTTDGGAVHAHPDFKLNMVCIGVDRYTYRYVQANGAVAASETDCSVSAAGQLTDSGGAYRSGTTAFADNEYGWVRNNVQIYEIT